LTARLYDGFFVLANSSQARTPWRSGIHVFAVSLRKLCGGVAEASLNNSQVK
jgi:hypothetical protein